MSSKVKALDISIRGFELEPQLPLAYQSLTMIIKY